MESLDSHSLTVAFKESIEFLKEVPKMIDRKVDKLKLICAYIEDVSEIFLEYSEKLHEITHEDSEDDSSSTTSKE